MRCNAVKNGLVAIAAAVAGLALLASPALAHFTYNTAGTSFGSAGTAAGQFNGPLGVAVQESTGDVYVVDSANKRVERFGATGSFLSTLNASEVPGGGFTEPTYVACDNSGGASEGQVYVADPGAGAVDAFDSSGKYLFQIAVTGILAVTVDSAGHLWVWTNQASFEEYSSSGALLLNHPVGRGTLPGIAVDSLGDVYVLYGSGGVGRYSPPSFEENNEGGSGGMALAIDPATDEIFQDEGSSIVQWPPFGEGPGLWERQQETITGGLVESRGLAVDGVTGTVYASDFSSEDVEMFAPIVVPDETTGGSSNLTFDSATVEGSVNPVKTKTSYFFEWGETSSYGNSTPSTEIGEGESAVPAGASLSGLEANTTYHYRIVASNEEGTAYGVDETFTTLPVLPVIEGVPGVSGVTRSSAVVSATVDPKHDSTSYHFLYVEDAEYEPAAEDPYAAGGSGAPSDAGAGSGGQVVEQVLNGLKPDTTYHYKVVAINGVGLVTGTNATFTTDAGTPPTAVTGAASGVAQNSATIAGTLNTSGLPTAYGFEVGTSTDYGPPTGLGSVGAGSSEAQVSLALTGLQPGTTYHYRLTATNVDGTSYGVDQTFTTGTFANTFAVPPAPLPFVAVPAIAFPAESPGSSTTPKALTKAQKLTAALNACGKKPKIQRAKCEKQARKRYKAPKKKAKKSKKR